MIVKEKCTELLLCQKYTASHQQCASHLATRAVMAISCWILRSRSSINSVLSVPTISYATGRASVEFTFPDEAKDALMTLLNAQHFERNRRDRLLDQAISWLDSPVERPRTSCRHSTRLSANKYSALFCRTPERSPDCWPEQRHAGRPSRRPAFNTYTANKEVICQSEATPSNPDAMSAM